MVHNAGVEAVTQWDGPGMSFLLSRSHKEGAYTVQHVYIHIYSHMCAHTHI